MEVEHGGLEHVESVFGKNKSFYEILNVSKNGTQKEIKKAYRKMALKFVSRR